ncbi:MAG: CHAT domain-containing tetratricopeptide repeat protein [Saprospiraceae bacterium]
MHSFRTTLVFSFLFAICCLLFPQSAGNLEALDARIDYFYQSGQQDSFLYYKNLMADQARKNDDLEAWSSEQLDMYDFLFEEGEARKASNLLNKAWSEKWREPRNDDEWGNLCFIQSYRGMDFLEAGKIMEATHAFEDAALMYEGHPQTDLDLAESIYKPLGNCYTMLGDNDKALAIQSKILQLHIENDALAGVYCNIGIAYWNQGDYDNAEKNYRAGLALTEVSGIKRALLLGALAQTLLDAGRNAEAISTAFASLSLLQVEKPGDLQTEYRCYSRRTAGLALMRDGKLKEAEKMLGNARNDAFNVFGTRSRELGKIEIAQAELLILEENAPAAMVAANEAMASVLPAFQSKWPRDNPDPATFYEENVIFEALWVKAKAALEIYEKSGDTAWLEFALKCHELAWQAESILRKVYQYSSSKLNLQSGSRLRDTEAMRICRLLFEKTGDEAYLAKAFSFAERNKALWLQEGIRENLVRQNLAKNDPRFSTLSALRQNFSLYEKKIFLNPEHESVPEWRNEADSLATQIKQVEEEIQGAYPTLVSAAQDSVSLPKIEHEEDIMLEYFAGQSNFELFVFCKNKQPVWYTIPIDSVFKSSLSAFLSCFEDPNAIINNPRGYFNSAQSIWKKLWPEEARSARKATLIPDGYLNFVPFDAMVCSPANETTNLRNADYLVKHTAISYAWSWQALQQQRKLHSKAKEYALCLAPGFANKERGLSPLNSDASEFPSNGHLLSGSEANLEQFAKELSDYRVVHLATHAFASAEDGQLPRVELYDQPLYLPSIYGLSLQADLLTLSACQTGLGKIEAGEGVMSLARAFAQAGAANVLSGLWSLNDKSTNTLLAAFYQYLESGKSIGSALQQAKLDYLENEDIRATVQSPYFWAGMVSVGDDRSVNAGKGGGWFVWVLVLAAVLSAFLFWQYKKRKSRSALLRRG